ncbi:MAG: ATP-binding protein [Bacteroidia bacterium]
MYLLLCSSGLLHAQDYQLLVESWGMEDGISHRDVQCVQRDDQGYIWIGTKYGLNRFDGYEFAWYTSETNAFQSDEINHILKDGQGRFWLIFTGAPNDYRVQSIDIFDPFSEETEPLSQLVAGDFQIKASDIYGFCQGEKGELFFVSKNRQFIRYDSVFHVAQLDLDTETPIDEMCAKDPECIMLVKRSIRFPREAYTIDKSGRILETFYKQVDYPICRPENFVQQVDEVYEVSAFHLILPNQEQSENLLEAHPQLGYITSLFMQEKGVSWIGTQFGLLKIEVEKNAFRTCLSNQQNDLGQHLRMRRMQVDPEGRLWAMAENKGGLWRVDLHSGEESLVYPGEQTAQALTVLRDGSLLFDRGYGNFNRINTREDPKEIQAWLSAGHPRTNFPIWTIHEDKYGQLWLGDTDSKYLRYFSHDSLHIASDWIDRPLSKFNLYRILEGEGDSVWFVGSQGLIRFNIRTHKAGGWYGKDGAGRYSLLYDNVLDMHPDADGSYWLATGGTGLVHWHPTRGLIRRYTRMDGMPNNTVYAIYEDRQDKLWMPTDNGIACLDKKTGFILGFGEEEGLSHYEFNRVSHCADSSGNLYFGSLHGITAFNPDSVLSHAGVLNPPLVINRFEQFDGKLGKLVDRTSMLRSKKQITLLPNDRFFKLDFSLLTFKHVEDIRYAFKIESDGKEETAWNFQRENVLRFSRLPYGSHIIHIKGQAGNGHWSDQQLTIHIYVLRPLYLRSWFIVLVLMAMVLALVLYFRYRTAKLKKQKRILEETVEARTETIRKQAEQLKSLEALKSRFFANVSHELRTPLTLILGPVQSLLKQKAHDGDSRKLLELVERNGRKLKILINEILDLSKLENNKLELNPKPVHFFSYILEHMAQFQSFASTDKLNFQLRYEADKELWIMLDKSKFEKVIDNFISNAMKFSPEGGEVLFAIRQTPADLVFEVRDEGKGIHPDDLPHIFDRFYQSRHADTDNEEGTGIGLSLSSELAALMQGEVWVESEPGNGSAFSSGCP